MTIATAPRLLGLGGDADWCRADGTIAFALRDAARIYQPWTMKPDGGGRVCLTATAAPGMPAPSLHKCNPTIHPSGEWIVMQGEIEGHKWVSGLVRDTLILNGLYCDLWAARADGTAWYALTAYASDRADGALAPMFSPDGRRLLWSRLLEPAGGAYPYGRYALMTADWLADAEGPRLVNGRDITPGPPGFHEAHGFTADVARAIYATIVDPAARPNDLGIWSCALNGSDAAPLADAPGAWEEHGHASPDGRWLAYMSSLPGWDGASNLTMKTEVFVRPLDGGPPRQVTRFNDPAAPEGEWTRQMGARPRWSPDGRSLLITQLYCAPLLYPRKRLWLFDAGAVG